MKPIRLIIMPYGKALDFRFHFDNDLTSFDPGALMTTHVAFEDDKDTCSCYMRG